MDSTKKEAKYDVVKQSKKMTKNESKEGQTFKAGAFLTST